MHAVSNIIESYLDIYPTIKDAHLRHKELLDAGVTLIDHFRTKFILNQEILFRYGQPNMYAYCVFNDVAPSVNYTHR